jgi:hypothetical protein
LLVVMLIAVGTISIAASLAYVSGRARVTAVHVEGAEVARLLAETGAERALAWATEVRATSIDFDRVLDPAIGTGTAANCNGLAGAPFDEDPAGGAPRAGADTFVPAFTEAGVTTAVYPPGSGKRWRLVPDAATGGAYLVRFEDNNDERSDNPVWNIASNNNVDGANNCNEGPAVGGENLARDRDNAVWLVSIGIYPGTNPVTAVHRQMVRKLINEPNTPDGIGMFVGTIVAGNVEFHNEFGTAHVGANTLVASTGNVSGGPFCGTIIAKGTIGGAQAADCGTNLLKKVPNTLPPPPVPPVGGWTVRSRRFHDWQSPCNFYSDPNVGFFYWDPTARWDNNTQDCRDYTGDLVPPNRDLTALNDAGNCWTPIFVNVAGIALPNAEYMVQSGLETAVVPLPLQWRPNGATQVPMTYTVSPAPTAVTNVLWYTRAAAGTVAREKPSWATCSDPTPGTGYPASAFRWLDPAPPVPVPFTAAFKGAGSEETCGAACNGVNAALDWDTAGTQNMRFSNVDAGRQAAPVGVYHVNGNYTVNNAMTGVGHTCNATDATNPDPGGIHYPMVTLTVDGDYVQTTNNIDVCWGVGSRGNVGLAGTTPLYPSLVVTGRLNLSSAAGNATMRTAGTMWVGNGIDIKKDLTVYGGVRVDVDFSQGPGGGPLVWKYKRDILDLRSQAQTAPLARVSYPTKF